MIDPPRLRDDAGGSIGEMLSAARADGPRDASSDKRRVLAALAALEGPALPSTGAARELDVSRSPRWMLGALAGAGLAVPPPPPPPPPSASSPNDRVVPTSPPAPASESTAAARETEESPAAAMPSIDVADLPSAARGASSAPVRRAEPAPTANGAPASVTTADELAAVERVRTQLAGGDAKGARRDIAGYRATFVRGRFVEEIDALEVEALAAEGSRAEAKAKAGEFEARYPTSPYVRRVRSVVVVSSLDETRTP